MVEASTQIMRDSDKVGGRFDLVLSVQQIETATRRATLNGELVLRELITNLYGLGLESTRTLKLGKDSP